jgi:hypothetical protein
MKPILPCLLAFLCCVSLPVSASEDVVASSPLASTQAVAPRVWAPALAPELTLDESSGYLRTAQPPGFAQLLVRIAGNAAAEATLVVSRPGDAASARSIRIQGDGWQRITLVYGRLGWSATNPLSVVISAPDFAGSVAFAPANDPAWPSGSGLSDAQLLNRLDLARPELAEVRTRYDTGDIPGAIAALARHFRTRVAPIWDLPELPAGEQDKANVKDQADRWVRGEVRMLNNAHTYPQGAIDWYLDPTVGGPNQTHEWIWSMNRHEGATPLLAAWRLTGDRVYLDTWAKTVRDWAQAMPVPGTPWRGPGSGWRLIEAGLRMGEFWPYAWTGFSRSEALSDADLILMVKCFWEHGEFLYRQPRERGNFYVLGTTGLHALSTIFPEFKTSPTWRRHAAAELMAYVLPNTETDGGWYERSPSYHQWIVNKIVLVLRASRQNGCADDFPVSFRRHVEKMAEWNVRISTPEGRVSALNDSSRLSLRAVATPLVLDEFPVNPVLKWAGASARSSKGPPLPPSEIIASGYTLLRTSWAKDAAYALFDVGPMGGGHGHLDALNLIYAPQGSIVLFDGTGGTYNRSAFRPWSVSTASHNTVMVDGANQFRPKDTPEDPVGKLPADTPAPVLVESSAALYAAGWHVGGYRKDGEIKVRHRREIVMLKSNVLTLVIDTMTPADALPHTYDLRWHALATKWTQHGSPAGAVVVPTDDGKALLGIIPLQPVDKVEARSGVTEPELLGWDVGKGSPGDVVKSGPPVPALTVRHLRTATGPMQFVTVLAPARLLGAGVPKVTARDGGWLVDLGKGAPPWIVKLSPATATARSPWCRIGGGDLRKSIEVKRTDQF